MIYLPYQSGTRATALIVSLMLLAASLSAQNTVDLNPKTKPPFKDRLFYGGSLGLQFGNLTLIDVSPMIGYKITPKVGVGVSPTYKYYGYKYNYGGYSINEKANIFGGSIFGRVIIYQNFFAHAEYEYLTYKMKDEQYSADAVKKDFQSLLVGAGYREPIADNAFMYLLVLWNLNETIDSPYTNPVLRAGFSIGF
jgi:hypothetical protein